MITRDKVVRGYTRHGFTKAEAQRNFEEALEHASTAAMAAMMTLEVNCTGSTPRGQALKLLAVQLVASLMQETARGMADDIRAAGGVVIAVEGL